MKYARVSGAVRYSGGTVILGEGMSADDDHPLVVERPDLFTDFGPPPVLRSEEGNRLRAGGEPKTEPKVERATRAPGEKRGGGARG